MWIFDTFVPLVTNPGLEKRAHVVTAEISIVLKVEGKKHGQHHLYHYSVWTYYDVQVSENEHRSTNGNP